MKKQKHSYQEKVASLRHEIKNHGLDGYLIPRADEFQGEFVAPYAERLKWLTGFTGSGGCAVVLEDKAFVLTDGRYTLQASRQVDSALFQTGDYIKKPIGDWLHAHAKEGAVIGFDPWLFTAAQIEKIQKKAGKKGIILKPVDENLVDQIWGDQPAKPNGAVMLFDEKVAGISAKQKCEMIGNDIAEQGGAAALLTMPDSIAWLLNVRGSDIDYIPSVLSYVLIDTNGAVTWFIDPTKISKDVQAALGKDVVITPPEKTEVTLLALAKKMDKPMLIDQSRTPIWFQNVFANAGVKILDQKDPTVHPKSLKTKTEQDAIRNAHIADGIALVKFMKWLEEEGAKATPSEISASEKLREFRSEHPAFKDDSFPTIAGFGASGAVIHYRASESTNTKIESGNMLLVDSGGQYCEGDCVGTTDITRTIGIGEVPHEMKESFTRVLQGHIALASAKFPKGTIGAQVDILARKPLWDVGLDYAHGTGHGVGCYLQVHEDAANISSRGQTAFEPGMLISNEPGYYKEGEYGIRTENLVLVKEVDEKSLCFETVSFAPIDRNLIVVDMLSATEVEWINAYHAQVFEKLSPHMDADLTEWLKGATLPIR